MSEQITEDTIVRMQTRCRVLLEKEVFNAEDGAAGAQALDATILTDQLVWQLLVPVVVSVAGGVLVEVAKNAMSALKSRRENEQRVKAMLNKPVVNIPQEQYRECVIIVREVLTPYGVLDEQVETIIRELIKEARS